MARNTGKDFESAFANWMRRRFGFSCELREQVKGRVAVRGWECDIHGVQHSELWRWTGWAAVAALVLGVASTFFPDLLGDVRGSYEDAGHQVEQIIGPSVKGLGVLIVGLLVLAVAWVGAKRARRHVWVECKSGKATIKRTDIIKLTEAAEDVRAFEGAPWRPDELWFATRSDYDADALNFAKERGVRCFRATGGEGSLRFEEV